MVQEVRGTIFRSEDVDVGDHRQITWSEYAPNSDGNAKPIEMRLLCECDPVHNQPVVELYREVNNTGSSVHLTQEVVAVMLPALLYFATFGRLPAFKELNAAGIKIG